MTREIKGPEDIEIMFSNANLRAVTAQEFGQALLLAMDSAYAHKGTVTAEESGAQAWRELAERLRSGK